MRVMAVPIVNGALGKRSERVGNQRKNRDHGIAKSLGDLKMAVPIVNGALGKRTERVGNQRKNRDHGIAKSLGDLKMAVPIVNGATGTVPKGLESGLKELEIRGRIETMALLRVLET